MTDAAAIIRTKRDNERPLTTQEIRWLFDAYAAHNVADEQMSALLMAIFFNGMTTTELRDWTAAMIDSGERLDLRGLNTVDKHSTGGVGDKVSLVLAPLVASCGAVVPQLSGRGLGHTGGTLDKLEAIPGWRATLTNDEMISQLRSVGAVIAAAGEGLAPADRRLYALRDVTGTVESIPLIASSIMSKKIAEGTGALVLDVKTGAGAFTRRAADARELAATMVAIGGEHGVRTRAFVTGMDTPLGRAAGNGVEVAEAVAALRGEGPADLMEVTLTLARAMLELADIDTDPERAIADGRALAAWEAMIAAQGGDPTAPLPRARHNDFITSSGDGYLGTLDAFAVGIAAWRLGAGRARKEDSVSHSAGVICHAKPGDRIRRGQNLLELLTDDEPALADARLTLNGAFTITERPPQIPPLVIGEVTGVV